jgi:hypothetical protein
MVSSIIHLCFAPSLSLTAFGGGGFLSFRLERTKDKKNHVNLVLSCLVVLEAVLKFNLMPDGGIASQLKMLTCCRVCTAFSPGRALPSKHDMEF